MSLLYIRQSQGQLDLVSRPSSTASRDSKRLVAPGRPSTSSSRLRTSSETRLFPARDFSGRDLARLGAAAEDDADASMLLAGYLALARPA